MVSEFLSPDEVSRYLKIPKETIYKLSRRGDIPCFKVGKQLRFRKKSIDRWAKEKELESVKRRADKTRATTSKKITSGKIERNWDGSERRALSRANVAISLRVTVETPPKGLPSNIRGRTVNISEGGLCFSSRTPLPTDLPVSLHIDTPSSTEVRARIIWSRLPGKKEIFRHGGLFLEMGEDQLLTLREVLWENEGYIKEHVKDITVPLRGTQIKNRVSDFFAKEMRRYIRGLIEINRRSKNRQISETLGLKKMTELTDRIVQIGSEVEKMINHKLTAEQIKKKFRLMVEGWAYRSPIVKEAYEKPRGYPGDYRMLEIIYDNQPLTEEKGMGSYFDRYFLNNPYARAVRGRKDKTVALLKSYIEGSTLSSISILNLACGSCREIRELLRGPLDFKELIFTCVDQDGEALDYSEKLLRLLPQNVKVKFLKENILSFLKNAEHYYGLLGRQNLIYSIGLADYLPDRILKRLIHFCFGLLQPQGKLIITHKDKEKGKFGSLPPDWFCDWVFVQRSKDDLIALLSGSGIKDFSLTIEEENSQNIFFMILTKGSQQE